MEMDNIQPLPSNIRRVKSGEENSQRTTFRWKGNTQANFISIVTEGVNRIWVKRGTCGGYLLTRLRKIRRP
jgi:hypothetical protein